MCIIVIACRIRWAARCVRFLVAANGFSRIRNEIIQCRRDRSAGEKFAEWGNEKNWTDQCQVAREIKFAKEIHRSLSKTGKRLTRVRLTCQKSLHVVAQICNTKISFRIGERVLNQRKIRVQLHVLHTIALYFCGIVTWKKKLRQLIFIFFSSCPRDLLVDTDHLGVDYRINYRISI